MYLIKQKEGTWSNQKTISELALQTFLYNLMELSTDKKKRAPKWQN